MTKTPDWKVIQVVGLLAAATSVTFVGLMLMIPALRADEPRADAALERTREQVKMLDVLYKSAVVSVDSRYQGPPAIKLARDVFAAVEKGGWHKAKLVDASGNPQNEANLPQTDFEKRAAKAMREGKPYYEEVSGADTGRRLYAATVVPAVTKKCANCHGVKEGELLGFIRYEVPVK
jgi:hypothetical protein